MHDSTTSYTGSHDFLFWILGFSRFFRFSSLASFRFEDVTPSLLLSVLYSIAWRLLLFRPRQTASVKLALWCQTSGDAGHFRFLLAGYLQKKASITKKRVYGRQTRRSFRVLFEFFFSYLSTSRRSQLSWWSTLHYLLPFRMREKVVHKSTLPLLPNWLEIGFQLTTKIKRERISLVFTMHWLNSGEAKRSNWLLQKSKINKNSAPVPFPS